MIVFELNGCGGLFEKYEGGVVTVYKGELSFCRKGKIVNHLRKTEPVPKLPALKTSLLFQAYDKWRGGQPIDKLEIESRHLVAYDAKAFDYDIHFLATKENKAAHLIFQCQQVDLDRAMGRTKRVNPTNESDAMQRVLDQVLGNAFGG